jgi:hypothetical protein
MPVEDSKYIGSVLHMLGNIISFSHWFLNQKFINSITKKMGLTIVMNNIIQEFWYGTGTDYELINLFKLHYIPPLGAPYPIDILKFILHKLHLELTNSKSDKFSEITKEIPESVHALSNLKSMVSQTFGITEDISKY